MKSLLLHLSVGLHSQDVPKEHQELIERFHELGYVKLEGNVYHRCGSFHLDGALHQCEQQRWCIV